MQTGQRSKEELRLLMRKAKDAARKYGQIGPYDTDDLVQIAMIKVLKRKGDVPPTTGWLYKVVRSVACDAGRQTKRESEHVLFFEDMHQLSRVCEGADQYASVHTSSTYIRPEDHDPGLAMQLKAMLSQLSAPLRQALLMAAEGYSYEEMAAVTKTNIGTVRSRLYYARQRAQVLLGEQA